MKFLETLSVFIPFLFLISCTVTEIDIMQNDKSLPEVNGDKFYYFGYGSNMLTKRIHIKNPTAVKIGAGELKNYRLYFNGKSRTWGGAPATILPDVTKTVQGTVWTIDLSNLSDIDRQEGVQYEAKSLPITLISTGEELIARVYLLTNQSNINSDSLSTEEISSKRLPSKTYIQCLVKGAIESGIEPSYVEWLRSLKHNGVIKQHMENFLELQNITLTS